MPDTHYHEFDAGAIDEAISAVRGQPGGGVAALAAGGAQAPVALQDSGHMFLAAQCIAVTVANRHICLNLPLHIGKVCLPVPGFVPNGTAAEACIGLCTHFGVPTGLKVTVTIAGKTVLQKTFGFC